MVTRGAAAVAVAAAVTLAGCGGSDSGQAQARQARAQAVTGTQALARQFLASGLGPVTGPRGPRATEGSYLTCPPARGTGMYYSTGFAAARVSEPTGRGPGYRQQVASVLTRAGWRLAATSTPQHEEPFGYTLSKGRLDGTALASLRSGGVIVVLISVNSPCFDPGAAAPSLRNKTDTAPLPAAGSATP